MLLGNLKRGLQTLDKSSGAQFFEKINEQVKFVVQMTENDFFASNERVELAHIMSWMLGCTEYGLLRTSGMEVGYYDRLDDKYCSYLRQDFPKSIDQKKP
jgi:hypothetical protein